MNTNSKDLKHIARAKVRLAKLESDILSVTLAMRNIENRYVALRWYNPVQRFMLERRYVRLDNELNNYRQQAAELRRYIANVQHWMLAGN